MLLSCFESLFLFVLLFCLLFFVLSFSPLFFDVLVYLEIFWKMGNDLSDLIILFWFWFWFWFWVSGVEFCFLFLKKLCDIWTQPRCSVYDTAKWTHLFLSTCSTRQHCFAALQPTHCITWYISSFNSSSFISFFPLFALSLSPSL